jgi:hypothetical protein
MCGHYIRAIILSVHRAVHQTVSFSNVAKHLSRLHVNKETLPFPDLSKTARAMSSQMIIFRPANLPLRIKIHSILQLIRPLDHLL